MEEDGAQCLICYQSLLSQVPCALRCGHVYHSLCAQKWFKAGKGECPQCKAKSSWEQLLLLDFEVAEVDTQSLEEAQQLELLSPEDRLQLREELGTELEDLRSRALELSAGLEEQREAAQESKGERRNLELQAVELEAELLQLRQDRESRMCSNASLSAQVDNQNSRQRQAGSRAPRGRGSQDSLKDDDPDCKEERRKLRVVRPADRARQLHEAVVSARQQEADANTASQQRETTLRELEEEITGLKKIEANLRRELRRRQEIQEVSAESKVLPSEARAARARARARAGAATLDFPGQVFPLPGPSSVSVSAPSIGLSSAGCGSVSSPRSEPSGSASGKTSSSASSSGLAAKKARQSGDTKGGLPAKAVLSSATGAGTPTLAAPPDDDDILYGTAPPRRTASLVVAAKQGDSGLGSKTTATLVASLSTPSRKDTGLRMLFSRRQA